MEYMNYFDEVKGYLRQKTFFLLNTGISIKLFSLSSNLKISECIMNIKPLLFLLIPRYQLHLILVVGGNCQL